jgi:hypothetical protein
MTSEAEKELIAKNKCKKKKTPRRKRKSRYKTGFHFSLKCKNPNNIFQYRSGWELTFGISLDDDPNVIEYEYETLKIPYILNNRTGKIRWYIPDFIVTYKNGDKIICEVKNTSCVNNIMVVKKAKAAELWAQKNGYTYKILTGDVITLLEKAQKVKKKV